MRGDELRGIWSTVTIFDGADFFRDLPVQFETFRRTEFDNLGSLSVSFSGITSNIQSIPLEGGVVGELLGLSTVKLMKLVIRDDLRTWRSPGSLLSLGFRLFRLVRACWNMEEVSGSGTRSGKENDVRSTSLTSSPSVSLAPLNEDCFLSIKL